MEQLIDVAFFLADRQDATVTFTDRRAQEVIMQVARLPGVLAAEPYRAIPVRVRSGSVERRILISARPYDADLSRVINVDLKPVVLPEDDLALSQFLAQILDVSLGDSVEIDLLETQRRTVSLPVRALVEDYFGIRGMIDPAALARLLRQAPTVTAVNVSLDQNRSDDFYRAIKGMPAVSGLALQSASLANFRQAVALLITKSKR
jgi:putative ABC transport system permease protein